MKVLGKSVTVILLLVFFVGLSLFLYPAISQYWNKQTQSRAVADYSVLMGRQEELLLVERERATAYNDRLRALPAPLIQAEEAGNYRELLNADGNGMMGYLTIDKLGVEIPIYHGTGDDVLNTACGHLEGSSLPVGGDGTHCVLSAHRGLPNADLFTHLDRLEEGDEFTVTAYGQVLTYQVDSVKVVKPNETGDLAIVPGKDQMTLLTCTPYGINTHRLLVRGQRVEGKDAPTVYIPSEAYVVDRLIVTTGVCIPILFLMTLAVLCIPPAHHVTLPKEEEE